MEGIHMDGTGSEVENSPNLGGPLCVWESDI